MAALHIPGKFKIHLWRLFNNFLPHYSNLLQRTLRVDVLCPICKKVPEDSERVWASLQLRTASPDSPTNCKTLFINNLYAADDQKKHLIAISLWALWNRRNKLINEGKIFSLQDLLGFIRGYSKKLSLSHEKLGAFCRPSPDILWSPPDFGVTKVNFDATFQCDSRTSTLAVIASDYKGDYLGTKTYLFNEVFNAFVAEVRASKRALLFATNMGFRRLLVE
ncbi:hypothetical protein V6Z11_A03G201900 [Gossypium hirsutum]